MLTENCVLRHEPLAKGANMGNNICRTMTPFDVALEVALVVEGCIALMALVDFHFVRRDVPCEQRLAGSLFSAMRAFEEGFYLGFAPRFFRHFHVFDAGLRLLDGRFTVILLIRHRQSIRQVRDCINHD